MFVSAGRQSRDPGSFGQLLHHPLELSLQGHLPVSGDIFGVSQVVLVVKNLSANAGDVRDTGSIPGLGRSPGGGNGNPLQYSCLKNPMDRAA